MNKLTARLDNVSKTYKQGSVPALRGVDFEMRPAQVTALLGPNGAGKTTAVKLMLGLAKPTSGSVTVFGRDPRNSENRMRSGAMLQVAKVPETLTVREHIDLFASYYPHPLPLAETLRIAGLEQLESRRFGALSGGQQRRLLFALAVCGDPDLIFLDEPSAGLDVEGRRILWKQIQSLAGRGKSILLTTHYIEEADALADRVVVINKGAILTEGTPAEIKQQAGSGNLEDAFLALTQDQEN